MTASDDGPTPLDQLPFEELARRACEVMGYEEYDHNCGFIVLGKREIYLDKDDEWNLFGLVVEWIEARLKIGELFRFSKNANGGDTDWIVTVWFNGSLFGTSSKAPTLTTAVLCWVVEHGEKIKGAKP